MLLLYCIRVRLSVGLFETDPVLFEALPLAAVLHHHFGYAAPLEPPPGILSIDSRWRTAWVEGWLVVVAMRIWKLDDVPTFLQATEIANVDARGGEH